MNTASRQESAKRHFEHWGFVKIPGFLKRDQFEAFEAIAEQYMQAWLRQNAEYYERGVLNAAYLTRGDDLSDVQKSAIFRVVASVPLVELVAPLLNNAPRFINTQLFFNPKRPQPNYWHRDGQYHLNSQQLRHALSGPTPLHCRIALRDEYGLELIPRTHRRWDTIREFSVRNQYDSLRHFDALPGSVKVPLAAGDLLLFSANMIHRGLYGKSRLALDLLYSEDLVEFTQYIDPNAYPSGDLTEFECPSVFDVSFT